MSSQRAGAERGGRPDALWRHADFLKLWTGQTISLLGTEITALAVPLTAVLLFHATPADMGLLRMVQLVPFLLIGLFAGVWVDRLRRRPVLIAADLGRAALLASIPAVYAAGSLRLPYLYIVAFLTGTLTVFFTVAYAAYLPSLVRREQLVEGNTRLEMSERMAEIAGTGLGGTLVQILTAPVAILADAASYLVSVLSLWLIRTDEPGGNDRSSSGMWLEMREGLGAVWRDPVLWALTASAATTNVFAGVVNSLGVLYEVRTLGFQPAVIGAVGAAYSVAGILGAVLAGRTIRRLGVGTALALASAAIGVGWLIIAVARGPTPVAASIAGAGFFVGGVADTLWNINAVSLRQAITPPSLLGRVGGTTRFLVVGAQAIGALLGGTLGTALGLRGALTVAGVGFLSSFLWILFSPVRRLRAVPGM